MSSKTRTFQITYFFQKLQLFKLRTFKNLHFQKLVLLKFVLSKTRTFKIRTFCRIPCFFQNFRVLKIPRSKFIWNSPEKFRVFFKNSPFRKKLIFTNSVFFPKNSVFYKIPRFSDFKSLKNTHEKHVFLYKNIYLQVKKYIFTD